MLCFDYSSGVSLKETNTYVCFMINYWFVLIPKKKKKNERNIKTDECVIW